jgi:hypothetical protein
MGANREYGRVEKRDVIDLLKKDFMAIDLAVHGADPMDRDVGAVCDDDVVAGVRDVLVIGKVAPAGEEVMAGTGVNAEVRGNILFIVTTTATMGHTYLGRNPGIRARRVDCIV